MLALVMGGQFGGEGKGNIVASLTRRFAPTMLVKTGGPNSSHTYKKGGRRWRLRALPAGTDFFKGRVVFPAGSLIHVPTLFDELDEVGFSGSLLIDPQAGVITEAHIAAQKADHRYYSIGSTRTGTGAACADRSLRKLTLARDCRDLRAFLVDTLPLLTEASELDDITLIEGSQGFGLSNYHGDYPYVTSRDTTASGLLSQLGVAPRALGMSILVLKCFPTRNAEGDGPLFGEEVISSLAVGDEVFAGEFGGGSYESGDHIRRIGLFDWDLALRAVQSTAPDFLAITGLDRLAALDRFPAISEWYETPSAFVGCLEDRLGTPVGISAWGPSIEDVEFAPPFIQSMEMN